MEFKDIYDGIHKRHRRMYRPTKTTVRVWSRSERKFKEEKTLDNTLKYVEKFQDIVPIPFQAYQFVTEVYKDDLKNGLVPGFLISDITGGNLIEGMATAPNIEDHTGSWHFFTEGDYIVQYNGGVKVLDYKEFENKYKPSGGHPRGYYIPKENVKEFSALQIFKSTADFLYSNERYKIAETFGEAVAGSIYGTDDFDRFLYYTRQRDTYQKTTSELGMEYKDNLYGNRSPVNSGDYLVYDHTNKTFSIFSEDAFERRFIAKK